MIDDTVNRPSTPSLIAAALSQLSRLVETEIRLAKAEIGEKVSMAVRAVAILAVALVLVIAALIFILQGIAQVLVFYGMQPFAASFTVGLVIAVLAAIGAWFALRSLSGPALKPDRTITQIRRNTDVIKDELT